MLHLLEKKHRWGNGLALWLVVGMAFLVPVSVWGISSLRIENDARQRLPVDNPDSRTLEWSRRYFASEEPVLCTWEGSTLDDPRIERLVRKIRGTTDRTGKRRGGSKLIDSVQTPQELIAQMQRNGISRDEAIARLAGVLIGSGPIRVRLTEFGRARREKVVDALSRRALESLAIQIEVSDPAASTSFVGETAMGRPAGDSDEGAGVAGESDATQEPLDQTPEVDSAPAATEFPELPPHDLAIRWAGMQWDASQRAAFNELALGLRLALPRSRGSSPSVVDECFQVPGTPVALAIFLSEAGNADRQAAVRWLYSAAKQVGIDPQGVHLGGSAVASTALDRETLKLAWDPAVSIYGIRRSVLFMSAFVAGVLALWLLRSFRLAGLVLAVSLYATLLSTALVSVTGGAMTVIFIVLPTLVLVTTLSLAIDLATHWRRADAADVSAAVTSALTGTFFPCLWTGLIVAIGQFSLMTSTLHSIRDFGLYSGLGMLISLAVTLYGLPALLTLWPAPRTPEPDRGLWLSLAAWLAGHRKSVAATGIFATAACLWGLGSFEAETRSISYLSSRTRGASDGAYLEDRLTGATPVDVIVRFDRESQQQLKFLQRRDLVERIESDLRKLPEISGSLSLVDFLASVPAPSEHASLREKARYNAASRAVEERVQQGELPAARSLLAVADDPSEYNAEGDELWLVRARAVALAPMSCQALRARIDEIASSALRGTSGNTVDKVPPVGAQRGYHPGASHVVTGELPLLIAAREDLLKSCIASFVCACGGVALIAIFVLRHPIAGAVTLIPNVLPIGAVLGVIAWCGVPLDLASAVAASFALGMAADGSLRQMLSFRSAIEQGKSRTEAVGQALERCAPAILRTTLVAGMSLVMLSHSELILIGRFGWITAALLAAGAVSNLTVTPALLAGLVGYALERSPARVRTTEAAREPAGAHLEAPAPVPAAAIPGKPHIAKKSVRIRRAD
jgi:predicted RND superfamily exporter protein